jgi:thiol:disulfide interchange protein
MNRRSLTTFAAAALAGALFTLNASAKDFPEGSPKFESKYKSALSEAKKTGKPVLLVFSATWCGPCQANKKNVYPAAAVKPYHDKFVWAYLDADDDANKKPMTEYGVDGIPHIQFLDRDGKSIDKLVGATTPDKFAKKLQDVLAKSGGSAPAKPASGLAPKKPASDTSKKSS